MRSLLLSLLTKKELADLTRRVRIAEMLLNGLTYEQIEKRAGTAKNTIALIKQGITSHEGTVTKLLHPEMGQSDIDQYFVNRLRRGK